MQVRYDGWDTTVVTLAMQRLLRWPGPHPLRRLAVAPRLRKQGGPSMNSSGLNTQAWRQGQHMCRHRRPDADLLLVRTA